MFAIVSYHAFGASYQQKPICCLASPVYRICPWLVSSSKLLAGGLVPDLWVLFSLLTAAFACGWFFLGWAIFLCLICIFCWLLHYLGSLLLLCFFIYHFLWQCITCSLRFFQQLLLQFVETKPSALWAIIFPQVK